MLEQPKPSVARMRTRDQAIAQLKKDDPETALTRNGLESLIGSGKVPHVFIGNKILINYDILLEVLAGGIENTDSPHRDKLGAVRPVAL